MARVMRNACFILGTVLGLVGCSTGSTMSQTQSPAAGRATSRYYSQAAVLQYSIMNRPPLELLEPSGEELVLDLARAQNCLASQTGNLDLAVKTQTLLTAYVEFHEENGSAPSRAFRRRARRAKIDAETTQQGTASPYFLGCSIPWGGDGSGSSRTAYRNGRREYYGTGRFWNPRLSVAGGVIR